MSRMDYLYWDRELEQLSQDQWLMADAEAKGASGP
jgi:hypothetical protein